MRHSPKLGRDSPPHELKRRREIFNAELLSVLLFPCLFCEHLVGSDTGVIEQNPMTLTAKRDNHIAISLFNVSFENLATYKVILI